MNYLHYNMYTVIVNNGHSPYNPLTMPATLKSPFWRSWMDTPGWSRPNDVSWFINMNPHEL